MCVKGHTCRINQLTDNVTPKPLLCDRWMSQDGTGGAAEEAEGLTPPGLERCQCLLIAKYSLSLLRTAAR